MACTVTFKAHQTKNRTEHTIPVVDEAEKLILELVKQLKDAPPYNAWSKPKKALDKASGVTYYNCSNETRAPDNGGFLLSKQVFDLLALSVARM